MSSLLSSYQRITQGVKSLSDFESGMAVVLGLITGASTDVKFGHVSSAGIAKTDVWELGVSQAVYIYPDAAGEDVTVNGIAGDTQNIVIEAINKATGLAVTVSVTLNEATPVNVPGGPWSAINRMFNDDSTVFVGPVTCQGDGVSSTNVFATMIADNQQSSQAIYMVPGNKVAVVEGFLTAVNRTGGATLAAIFTLETSKPNKVFRVRKRQGLQKDGSSNVPDKFQIPLLIGPLSKIKATAFPTSADTDVSAEIPMKLVDKDSIPADILAALL